MTLVKICGITNKVDAIAAAMLGVDMLGFVFYKKSERYVPPMVVEDIGNEVPPRIAKVGVFVNESRQKVEETAQDASLDILQFHGEESPEYCGYFKNKYKVIKAFRIKDNKGLTGINSYDVDYYLFDTYKMDSVGGTGETFDWKVLKDFEILKPFILSGGLKPGNVAEAIKEIVPYGVDVSTGVEKSPGVKDSEAMKRFIENVRKAD